MATTTFKRTRKSSKGKPITEMVTRKGGVKIDTKPGAVPNQTFYERMVAAKAAKKAGKGKKVKSVTAKVAKAKVPKVKKVKAVKAVNVAKVPKVKAAKVVTPKATTKKVAPVTTPTGSKLPGATPKNKVPLQN